MVANVPLMGRCWSPSRVIDYSPKMRGQAVGTAGKYLWVDATRPPARRAHPRRARRSDSAHPARRGPAPRGPGTARQLPSPAPRHPNGPAAEAISPSGCGKPRLTSGRIRTPRPHAARACRRNRPTGHGRARATEQRTGRRPAAGEYDAFADGRHGRALWSSWRRPPPGRSLRAARTGHRLGRDGSGRRIPLSLGAGIRRWRRGRRPAG